MAFPEVHRERHPGGSEPRQLVGADCIHAGSDNQAHCGQGDQPASACNGVDKARYKPDCYEKDLGIRQGMNCRSEIDFERARALRSS